MTRTREPSPLSPALLQHLDGVRVELLRLHKILLDDERASYEKTHGPMGAPGRVLSLVMSDPFFDWLHVISRFIVSIDETMEASDATEDQAFDLFAKARSLILGKGAVETEFTTKYRAALQRNPAAVLAHSEVLKALRDD